MHDGARARPAARLRPSVAGVSGWRSTGAPPFVHHGLPSPYVTFIVTVDQPLAMPRQLDGTPPAVYETLVGGLHTTPALVGVGGDQTGIQLSLHPLGARTLFGVPAGELAHVDVEATDVAPWVGVLRERLAGTVGWAEAFAVVDDVLAAALQEATIAPELAEAWRRLAAGSASVADVAAEVGWSPRRLSGRFAAEFGVSPKQAARLGRFDRARRTVQRSAAPLADVAVACGYFDQAHLAREFREFAGVTAGEWLDESRRFVQAEVDAVATDSAA